MSMRKPHITPVSKIPAQVQTSTLQKILNGTTLLIRRKIGPITVTS